MGGSVDDLRQRAAEEIAEREKLERVGDVAPDAMRGLIRSGAPQ